MTRSSSAPDLMRRYYPSCRHVLLLSLLLFPAFQFAVFAMVGGYSERIRLLIGELTIVWVVFLSIRINKWIAEDLLLVNATRLSVLFGAAVAGVGGSLVIADLDLLFERLISSYGLAPPLALQRASLELQVVGGLSEVPLALAAIVVAPAVCEEAFFRGFLLTSLVVRLGPKIGLAISALIFAAVHVNPWQFPALLLFGLFLGLLTWWTHSIYPAILAHGINNLLSLVGTNTLTYTGVDAPLATDEYLPLPILAVALVCLWLGLTLVRRRDPLVAFAPLLQRTAAIMRSQV